MNVCGILTLTLALLTAAPALGGGAREPPADWLKQQEPPPQYAGPYEGKLTVRILPLEVVGLTCAARYGTWGCARVGATACTIIIPKIGNSESGHFVTQRLQDLIRRHEIGHCNGWPATHPDGRDWQRTEREAIAARPPEPAPSSQEPELPAAQRVVLYEEDSADPFGKRFIGSAIWRTETVTPVGGQAPDLAVRCDVAIPQRQLGMTLSIRRNSDQALPASHTVELMFNLPADFSPGGISNVPGMLMKQAEATRGAPLSGLAVKVTSGLFLLGLSSVKAEAERNRELLKERAWIDIPVVYNNGRRAIIAVEKGASGERAFAEAFRSWGQ
jgi:hypothetical protein